MPLHRLIYCSRAVEPSASTINAILAASHRNNPSTGLTGMLLFTSDCFMQLLEGDRSSVNNCFQRIINDPRHQEIEIISYSEIDFRFFDQWSMDYVPHSADTINKLKRYSCSAQFDPYSMSASATEQLCLDFSVRAHHAT